MLQLLLAQGLLALLAVLVVLFVAFPYRGRAVPRAERLTDKVLDLTARVRLDEAPPLGVLTSPEKSRQMSQRFERVETTIRRGARAVVPAPRD